MVIVKFLFILFLASFAHAGYVSDMNVLVNDAAPSGTNPLGVRLSDGTDYLTSFDLDNTAGVSKILGVSIRTLSNGTPIEFGTPSNPFRVDTTGATTQPISAVSLPLPAGAATEATAALINGKLNALTTTPTNGASGLVVRPITVELPTFSITATNVTVGNNKSMLAIQNTSTSIVRIREIWIINDKTTAVTGVAGNFQVFRITSFTGGAAVTPVTFDTDDTLTGGITAATGSTVSGEAGLLRQGVWSTDEWGPGTLDTESNDHTNQNSEPFWKQTPNGKALTLRQNQGLHIKFATNSTAGAFNIRVVFTTE